MPHTIDTEREKDGQPVFAGNAQDMPWPRPFQLVSLADMRIFLAYTFDTMKLDLCFMKHAMQELGRRHGAISEVSDQTKSKLKEVTERIEKICTDIEMPSAAMRARQITRKLTSGRCSYEILEGDVNSLEDFIHEALKFKAFAYIPKNKTEYFNCDDLFGEQVSNKFKRAKGDIRDAGNCIAVELHTAAVFHLMRVAEWGLRRIAGKLKVQLTHAGRNIPVEFADWKKIIDGISVKIEEARALAPGPAKQGKLEFYSDAADHCTYMKDIWRNNVSHTRTPYKEPEAIAVLERVRDFMKFLAANL